MLKQLIKYELKATSRTFAGLYLALMAVVVALGLSMRLEIGGDTVIDVLVLVYGALCVAIAVVTLLQIVERFAKNLLGREGYLMHTLPVTENQLILSKLLTSVLWAVCGVLVGLLSMAVLFGILCFQPEVMAEMSELFAQLRVMQEQVHILGELVQGVAAGAICFGRLLPGGRGGGRVGAGYAPQRLHDGVHGVYVPNKHVLVQLVKGAGELALQLPAYAAEQLLRLFGGAQPYHAPVVAVAQAHYQPLGFQLIEHVGRLLLLHHRLRAQLAGRYGLLLRDYAQHKVLHVGQQVGMHGLKAPRYLFGVKAVRLGYQPAQLARSLLGHGGLLN